MTDDDDFGPLTEKVLARREQSYANMTVMTGINSRMTYLPGIVTLSLYGELAFVAWKIDDPIWHVAHHGEGPVRGSTWYYGVMPCDTHDRAETLYWEIIDMVTEFGLVVETEICTVAPIS